MRIEPFEPRARHPIRAPHEHALRLDAAGRHTWSWLNGGLAEGLAGATHEPERRRHMMTSVPSHLRDALLMLHARGDPAEELARRAVEAIDCVESLAREYPASAALIVGPAWRPELGALAICLLTLADAGALARLAVLIRGDGRRTEPVVVRLLEAFLADRTPALDRSGEPPAKFTLAWTEPFARALAGEDREAGLRDYLDRFERRIASSRPFGWKPWDEERVRHDADGVPMYGNASLDFAFEVALAVCAWDLDDAGLRDHPYYPADLVDHYRGRLRRDRDGWRAPGAGPDVPIEPPPVPRRVDLGASRRRGLARWVELVADGDADATASVLDACGRPRRIEDLHALVAALDAAGIAISADWKDDETLAGSARRLIEPRIGADFDVPDPAPPAGHRRCRHVLDHAARRLASEGHASFEIDTLADYWAAVVVRAEFAEELDALSARLGLRAVRTG